MNRSTLVVALVSALLGGGGGYAMHSSPPVSQPGPQQPRRPAPGTPPVGQAVPRPSGPMRAQPNAGEITVRTPHVFPPPGIDLGGYGWYGYPPYWYGYPYPYGYPAPWSVERTDPGMGEVRLDVPQKDATVYVDGFYVGVVNDYNGIFHHLRVAAGPHTIEIRKPGYETLIFNVIVQADQTITYRDVMQPAAANAPSPTPSSETPDGTGAARNPVLGAPLPRMFVGPPGDVRFEVSPKDARIYVDGLYAGVVDDFNGRSQHLTLPAGPHHLMIRADGYEDLEVDLAIQPRQTTTYGGELKRSATQR